MNELTLNLLSQGNGLSLATAGRSRPDEFSVAAMSRLRENMEHNIRVRLHESEWFHLENDPSINPRPASRKDLMTVLESLDNLLIRATYHTAQETV